MASESRRCQLEVIIWRSSRLST